MKFETILIENDISVRISDDNDNLIVQLMAFKSHTDKGSYELYLYNGKDIESRNHNGLKLVYRAIRSINENE